MLPPGELEKTHTSSLILAHSHHDVKTWRRPQNRKYITYCIAVRGGPSHGHRTHVQKIWWICTGGFRDKRVDTQTDRHTHRLANCNTSHFCRGQSNSSWLAREWTEHGPLRWDWRQEGRCTAASRSRKERRPAVLYRRRRTCTLPGDQPVCTLTMDRSYPSSLLQLPASVRLHHIQSSTSMSPDFIKQSVNHIYLASELRIKTRNHKQRRVVAKPAVYLCISKCLLRKSDVFTRKDDAYIFLQFARWRYQGRRLPTPTASF